MANDHQQPDGSCPGAQPGGADRSPDDSRAALANFARRLLLALLILAVAYLAWLGVHVLLLTFAGVLFAVFLSSVSDWLSRATGLGYRWALGLVVLALLALAVGAGWLLADRLGTQVAQLAEQLPQSLERIRDYLSERPWGRLLLENAPQAAKSIAQTGDFSRVTGLVSGVSGFLFGAVVVLFVGVFGAADPDVYKKGLLHLIPPARRPRAAQAIDAIAGNLHWWLVGQAVLMVVMAVTTSLGLWLIGIRDLALTLGLITGLLEIIPYIGAWLSAVPSAMVALLVGPGYLVAVLGLYLGLHILEGYVLAPLIQSRAVHLPPALTLVAQVLLGEVAGVLGLLVAAPLTVVAIVAVKLLYLEDALGDHSVGLSPASGKAGPGVRA
jgi:predicted PurR-regulated permease PerM